MGTFRRTNSRSARAGPEQEGGSDVADDDERRLEISDDGLVPAASAECFFARQWLFNDSPGSRVVCKMSRGMLQQFSVLFTKFYVSGGCIMVCSIITMIFPKFMHGKL